MICEGASIPSRLKVGVLGCFGCALLFLLRSNLSVAIIAMVDQTAIIENKGENRTEDLCYDTQGYNRSIESGYHGSYKWSTSVQGIILGSYFYGYTITQMLGTFADRFGAKWMCGLGVFFPAIFNALIPVLSDIHYALIIVMRLLIGAFHGLVYSSLFSLFAKWFPQNEKILAITGTMVSSNLGGIIAMPLSGYLVSVDFLGGWPTIFYITSIIHVIWFIFWCFCVSDSPEEDRNITEKELKYISANNPNSKNVKNISIPWFKILTSKVLWASIVTKVTSSFGYYLLFTNMPQYLDSVFGMSIQKNTGFNSLMYVIICITLIAGAPLSTCVQNKRWFTHTRNRKNFQSLAMFGCVVCQLLVPIVGCNANAVIAFLLLGNFFFGFITGGEYAVIPEFAPDFSGTVFGVANTLASATGFVGPMIVGYLLEHADGSIRKQWNIIWYISAAVYAFGGIFFELFGSAEVQPWAMVSVQDEKKLSFVSDHFKEEQKS